MRRGGVWCVLMLGALLGACGGAVGDEPGAEASSLSAPDSARESQWKEPDAVPLTSALGRPSVAFDGRNFFTVWRDIRSGGVYGARVRPDGKLLDPDGIPIGTGFAPGEPRVAFDGTRFIVVWFGGNDLVAVPVERDGTRLLPGFILFSSDEHSGPPAIACGQGVCLLVLVVSGDDGLALDSVFFRSDGTRPGGGTPVLSPTVEALSGLSVAWDGARFFVVWSDSRAGTLDIFGARVLPDGTSLDPGGFPIAAAPGSQRSPEVTWTGRRFLVVWDDDRRGDRDIFGARVRSSGAVDDPEGIPVFTGQGEQHTPAVAHHEGKSLVAWTDTRTGRARVRGTLVKEDGKVVSRSGFSVSQGDFPEEFLPSLAAGCDRYFVAYGGGASAEPFRLHDILGVRLTRKGHVLDEPTLLLTGARGGELPE
jgi:hypothetical protein